MADSIERIADEVATYQAPPNGQYIQVHPRVMRDWESRLRALSPAGGDWVMVPARLTGPMAYAMVERLGHPDSSPQDCWTATIAASPQQEPGAAWRCFHCDETFTDRDAAAVHFGTHEYQSPACLIDAAEYRRMEAKEARYAEEDADCHRAMHRQHGEHQQALRRAEEAGYAKGLCDSGQCQCASAKQDDPIGQTLAGAGGDAVKPADVERALSIFYGKPWPNGYVRDVQEKARSNMYRVLRHLTATSAGTTGDDSEDAARNELELLREDIEAYHMAMDDLGLAKRADDHGRAISMYGRAFISMVVFATQQRQAVINTAAELVQNLPPGSPQPGKTDAARRAREVGNG